MRTDESEIIVKLTDADRNLLQKEKRIGFVLAAIIFCCVAIFNVLYFMLNIAYNYFMIALISFGVLIVAWLVCNRVNYKANKDLRNNTKLLLKRRLNKKSIEKLQEADSEMRFVTLLKHLFSKRRIKKKYGPEKYIIFTRNHEYEVDKAFYYKLKENSDFYIHLAKHSNTILGFSLHE